VYFSMLAVQQCTAATSLSEEDRTVLRADDTVVLPSELDLTRDWTAAIPGATATRSGRLREH
jgi:hypothetical protein